MLNKIHKKQCITQNSLENSHNFCLRIYILVCFIPAANFITDTVQQHPATKGNTPGLFKAKLKNAGV